MASKIPPTVCSAPWMHFAIGSHPDGFITTPCCRFRLGNDSRFNKYKFENPQQAISRNGYLETIRQQMLTGERLHECQKCWREERDKGWSMRQTMLKRMSLDEVKTAKSFDLRYLEVFFSNLCNLSCRMCSIVDSSQWANLYNNAFLPAGIKDTSVVPDEFIDQSGKAKTQPIGFDSNLLEGIDLSNLVEVKILGGEPMMTPDHVIFLDQLMSQSKDPSQIKLVYHTNGTKRPPQKVIDYWKQMHEIELVFSIDGLGSVNEYQRIGSVWNTIEENIDWYQSLDVNFHMRIHSVLSILNVWHIDRLCDWIKQKFNTTSIFNPIAKMLTIDFVQRPNYLDITIMPDKLKTNCIETINASQHLDDDMKNFIIAYTKSNSYNKEYWNNFWQRMSAIDQFTNQSLLEIVPQLKNFKP